MRHVTTTRALVCMAAAGLAFAANMIGVPPVWIGIGVVVLIGLGILTGVSRTKRPDPPAT